MEKRHRDELRRLTRGEAFRRELRGLLRMAFNYEPRNLDEAPPESLALLYMWAKVMLSRRRVNYRHR